jgi:hypothetical protein
MGYFFAHKKDGSGHGEPIECQTAKDVVGSGGVVNENNNGTVSVYDGKGNFVPLTKTCCEALNSSYTFDCDKQECRWGDDCQINNGPIKLVINSIGNAGSIFDVNSENGESCTLNITFDYLFQFDCDVIYDALQANQLNTLNNEQQQQVSQLSGRCEEISSLVGQLEYNLIILTEELNNTPYVIQCNTIITGGDGHVPPTPQNNNFNSLLPPNAFPINEYGMVTYCLTLSGLTAWNNIIGVVNYNTWFASEGTNTTVYTCTDVDTLINQDGGSGDLLGTCDVSITARVEIISNINQTQDEIVTLTQECDDIQTQIAEILGDTNCNTFLEILETLNVSMTLDVIDPISGISTTIFEQEILNIDTDGLLDYLTSTNGQTGFYMTGSETTNICEVVESSLVDNIIDTGADLSGLFNSNEELVELVHNSLNSEWLGADINITDPAIISGITNQEIKISLRIDDCCVDFGILIDRIRMDKNCEVIEGTDLRISQCPSFNMIRVCDNKKSWLANEVDTDREFDLKLRDTGYNIKDYRLAINSKEVDLDINPANAIEQDLYCYVRDNDCILDCSTGSTSITAATDYDFGAILSAQTLSCEPEFTSACTSSSIWGIRVSLGCETIYNNDSFYSSTGITDTPTQEEYIIELSGIATTLGLEFTSGATNVTFTEIVDCDDIFLGNNFRIDLTLDISTLCNKQFQDGEFFLFQDGEPYEFN